MNRRSFIEKTALGTGAMTILPNHVLGHSSFLAPSDRINLGYIGVGKQSLGLLSYINECPETIVLAASDVDQKKLKSSLDSVVELSVNAVGVD